MVPEKGFNSYAAIWSQLVVTLFQESRKNVPAAIELLQNVQNRRRDFTGSLKNPSSEDIQ